ncbi:MAG: DUF3656 domain-containing protein [Lachnospiraceae bacterium]
MKQRKPEILAPAGSVESLRAAVAAGADAVYIGGSRFGARAYAESTQNDSLLAAIDYAHLKNRRVYLTVNTLLKEQELSEELYDYIRVYYEGGVDAVIVQDVGVLHFLAAHFPKLPIHASTQMTLVSGDGVSMLSGYPVTRVVPARELSLAEVRQLRESTALELETFVHGALCYCYSGQCLFSSMIGGRSGNRGRCAQPCRMPYTLSESGEKVCETAYLLSPKDMCTLDKIPQLVLAGIDSFKIEGRMKRPEYTAGVTAAYRKLTDLYFEYGEQEFDRYLKKHPQILTEQLEHVSDLYNRGGFTDGYYFHYHGPDMMSMERPNHSGLLVGEVVSTKGGKAGIRLDIEAEPQDVLEIRAEKETYEFTVGKAGLEQKGFYETNVKRGFPLTKGLPVYRTKNESLLKLLKENYSERTFQSKVNGVFTAFSGKPASLTVSIAAKECGSILPRKDDTMRTVTVTVKGDVVTEAKNQPVTKEKIEEQLKKTGESDFSFESLSVQAGDNIFLPMGKIKELRREAFARLAEEILSGYKRKLPEKTVAVCHAAVSSEMPQNASACIPELICLVSERAQWKAVMDVLEVSTVYLDLQNEPLSEQLTLARQTEAGGKKAFLVFPHIFRQKERVRYEQAEELFSKGGFSGVLVKSLEELAFLKEQSWAEHMEIRLNYNLYVYNSEAKRFFREQGYSRFTAPVELNSEELETLGVEDCDLLVYGRLPLMVSTQCVRDNVLVCRQGKVTDGLVLTDRVGAAFPVRQICTSCYNIIYNSVCLSFIGFTEEMKRMYPKAFRLDFTLEPEEEVKRVLKAFRNGETLSSTLEEVYTKGHWKRGIL